MKLNLTIGAAVIAAAGLMAGVANASTIGANTGTDAAAAGAFDFATTLPVNFSLEGETLYGSTGVTTLPPVLITLGSDYTAGDLITLAVGGATVGGNTSSQLNSNPAASSASGNLGIHCWLPAPLTEDALIVSFLSLAGNNITLRVTQKNSTNVVGAICRVWGIDVTSPSISRLTAVTESWVAQTATGTVVFDASAPAFPVGSPVGPTTVAQTVTQFVTTWGPPGTTSLSGVVDVTSGRIEFVGGGVPAPTNADSTNLTAVDLGAGTFSAGGLALTGFFAVGTPVVTLNTVTSTLTGIFTNLLNPTCTYPPTPASAFTAVSTSNAAPSGATTLSADCLTIQTIISPAARGATEAVSYTFEGTTGKVIVAPQTFTGTVKYAYTGPVFGGTTTTASRTDPGVPGAWTLNGFSAFVSYMPFGTGISQILYLTNKSSQTGSVTIVGYNDQGQVLASFTAGTVQAHSVLALSTALANGVAAAFPSFTGKVSFNVIANVPAGTAELYSAYNVSGNRVSVLNTSNGRVTTGTGANSTTGTAL